MTWPTIKTLIFTFVLTTAFAQYLTAQINITPSVANFLTVDANQTDSITITVTNGSTTTLSISKIRNYHDVFSFSDSSFTIPPNGNATLTVFVKAAHNLDYWDQAFFESTTHPDIPALTIFASVWYPDTYYDASQDLSNEDLKASLKTTLESSAVQFTYTVARDKIFMDIDNQKVNGQGASQNTIECVYTGKLVTGYVSRTDAQTSGNFNTEHSFPQSKFGQAYPMLSDMHHLFPTFATANSQRSNKPYGTVSNPSWTDGGSKSNSTHFEPRDLQKGIAARTLFYFVIRYSDTTGFVAPQETLLRQWDKQFPPTTIDSTRNELIFGEQFNRNPFIDHPEFLDRIASVTTTDSGNLSPSIHTLKSMEFASVMPGDTLIGELHISNQGARHSLNLSAFSISDPAFFIIGNGPTEITADDMQDLQIGFSPSAVNQSYSANLTFVSDDPENQNLTIPLNGNSIPVGRAENILRNVVVFPVPADEFVNVKNLPLSSFTTYSIIATNGKLILDGKVQGTELKIPTSDLNAGMYYLQLHNDSYSKTVKLPMR